MPKCLWIDASNGVVIEKTFAGLTDLQRLVGGSIELAYHWPNGDVLFVNEEGLVLGFDRGFNFSRRSDQWLAGNGVVVGREVEGPEYPNGYTNLDPKLTVQDLRGMVDFRRVA